MADFWIVSAFRYKRLGSLEEAEEDRRDLSWRMPEKTFRIMRCKTGLRASQGYAKEVLRLFDGAEGKEEDLKVAFEALAKFKEEQGDWE